MLVIETQNLTEGKCHSTRLVVDVIVPDAEVALHGYRADVPLAVLNITQGSSLCSIILGSPGFGRGQLRDPMNSGRVADL